MRRGGGRIGGAGDAGARLGGGLGLGLGCGAWRDRAARQHVARADAQGWRRSVRRSGASGRGPAGGCADMLPPCGSSARARGEPRRRGRPGQSTEQLPAGFGAHRASFWRPPSFCAACPPSRTRLPTRRRRRRRPPPPPPAPPRSPPWPPLWAPPCALPAPPPAPRPSRRPWARACPAARRRRCRWPCLQTPSNHVQCTPRRRRPRADARAKHPPLLSSARTRKASGAGPLNRWCLPPSVRFRRSAASVHLRH